MIVIPALALLLGCAADSTVAASPEKPAAVVEDRNYSFSITPSDATVHVKFSRVRPNADGSVREFLERMFASADAAGATRLVVDLSATKGGDSFLLVPLVKGVIQRQQFARRGGLVVVVGPDSFSPAQNAAAVLKQYANPIFVDHSVK
jgi:hypothetical protein